MDTQTISAILQNPDEKIAGLIKAELDKQGMALAVGPVEHDVIAGMVVIDLKRVMKPQIATQSFIAEYVEMYYPRHLHRNREAVLALKADEEARRDDKLTRPMFGSPVSKGGRKGTSFAAIQLREKGKLGWNEPPDRKVDKSDRDRRPKKEFGVPREEGDKPRTR